MAKFVVCLKKCHNDLDIDPSTLKVDLAQDIISNICMK